MEELKIRTLMASEIDVRVKTWDKSGKTWAMMLLYKDARVDQRLLDETFGAMNWKRSHEIIDGHLYCTISVWNERAQQWVGKQDVGTESDTEKEKGQASDAFKRAGFNWGIGRELYSAPKIFVRTTEADYDKAGKFKTILTVKEIGYDDDREISKLVLIDNNGAVRFTFGVQAQAQTPAAAPAPKAAAKPAPAGSAPMQNHTLPEGWTAAKYGAAESKLRSAQNRDEVTTIYQAHTDLRNYSPWMVAVKQMCAKYPKQ